jgi:uncharacterized protein (TIGR02679 family)
MSEIPAGLVAWARLAGPALVLHEVCGRVAKGARTEQGTLRVALTIEQRRQVARLLGTPWELTDRPVRLQDLAAVLAEHGLTVRGLVEGVDGKPLVNVRQLRADERASARTASEQERAAVVELLEDTGVVRSAVQTWLDDQGLPKAGCGELLALAEKVAAVWRRLPGYGGAMALAQLAANVADFDAHALDYGQLLGRSVARLVAAQHGLPRPLRAGRDWRLAWAGVGVKCNGVSSRVLVLNLPLQGELPAVRWCAETPGEPIWLTLRSITGPWTAPAKVTVFVCENVTVLETAADRLGADCPPVICTDGFPANVALDLIAGLSHMGCALKVRADFDGSGLAIVDQVRSVAPAAAGWRYDAVTYAAHLGLDFEPEATGGNELEQLRAVFGLHGTAVHEEAILDQLMADLVQACRSTGTSSR